MRDKEQQRSALAIASSVALALLLIWPVWLAIRNGQSGLYAQPAIDYLEEQRANAFTVSRAEWYAIEYSVNLGDKIMPSNPEYLHTLGFLHQLKLNLFASELSSAEIDTHSNAARDFFQKAVESRPTWPYYWGNLALEHRRDGNVAADEFSLALANASQFGPWKDDLQRLVLELGSENWQFLSSRARHEVILNVDRGLQRQTRTTIRILQTHGAWPLVCEASAAVPAVNIAHLRATCDFGLATKVIPSPH